MATSIELENVGRERYMVKDVKAKIQVDQISKELKALEVDDKDFYVCVNRDVKSKFIKDDESKEDKIDQFVVKHCETITVVQGLANTKLTNPDEWIIKIKRELSETTFFKGKEIINKISQRQEKLERNKENPIVKAAIAKELLKRSKEEQKIESNADQEEENGGQMKADEPLPIIKETAVVLDDSDSSKDKWCSEANKCFAAETTPGSSPDATKDELDISPKFTTFIEKGVIKVKAIGEKEVENGTTIVELVKRDVVSEVDPSNSTNQSEKLKMATLEADVKKDSTNGVRYVESVKKEMVATLNNQSEKEAIDTAPVMTDVKQVIDAPASAPLSAPDAENDVEFEIHGPSNPSETWKLATVEAEVENGTTNQTEKLTNGKTTLEAKSNVNGDVELPTRVSTEIKNEKASSIEYGARDEILEQKEFASDPNELLKIERELEQESSKIDNQRSSIYAKEDPEAGAEAGKQRVREVFHMDVAELIIERDA